MQSRGDGARSGETFGTRLGWLEWLGIQRPADLWLATLALATSFHYELHFGQGDLLLLGLEIKIKDNRPFRADAQSPSSDARGEGRDEGEHSGGSSEP